jgi:hypothetical protein
MLEKISRKFKEEKGKFDKKNEITLAIYCINALLYALDLGTAKHELSNCRQRRF